MSSAGPPIDEFHEFVGERIRFFRKERGWGQRELAGGSKMSVRTLGLYERGQREVSTSKLVRICVALGIHPGQMLEGSDVVIARMDKRAKRDEKRRAGQ